MIGVYFVLYATNIGSGIATTTRNRKAQKRIKLSEFLLSSHFVFILAVVCSTEGTRYTLFVILIRYSPAVTKSSAHSLIS